MIGQQHFGPQLENRNFTRYVTNDEKLITVLVFILGYFKQKVITKFFKSLKKTYFKGSSSFSILNTQLSTITQRIRKSKWTILDGPSVGRGSNK